MLAASLAASMLLAAAPVIADEPANPVAPPGTVITTVPPVEKTDEIRITYNGEEVETDVPPVIVDGRTLVPARAVFEAMGCEVSWEEDYQYVHVQKTSGDRHYHILLAIGSDIMEKHTTYIPGSDVGYTDDITLEVPAQLIGDRTMIPVRAVAEALDANVDWDDVTRTVIITDAPAQTAAPSETTGPAVESTSFEDKIQARMPSDKNYSVSPLSLKIALAMYANGADEAIQSEILDALDIDDLDEYNDSVRSLIEKYAAAEAEEKPDEYGSEPSVFKIADSIWINRDGEFIGKNAEFKDKFRSVITDYYNGEADSFTNKDGFKKINSWVSGATNDRIQSIFGEEEIPVTEVALINAIYMKAAWAHKFKKTATSKDIFTDRNGKETAIDFMHDQFSMKYYENGDIKIIELPYAGGGAKMYIANGAVTPSEAKAYMENAAVRTVNIAIPKWKTESSFDLVDTMKALGVEKAFDANVLNYGMLDNAESGIFINVLRQKTYIDVDENGTEAAAVTGVGAGGASMPAEIMEFKADKPFTYFIYDGDDNLMFMGEYAYAE